MEQRINPWLNGSGAMKAMFGLSNYLSKCQVEKHLLNLIYFRVSQVNGCAYCLDMHAKDLRIKGESEQRLYVLDAWREAPFYSKREQAALAWAEAVTKIKDGNVADDVYAIAKEAFSEAELADITLAVITINSYNRINIAFRVQAGTYEPVAEAV